MEKQRIDHAALLAARIAASADDWRSSALCLMTAGFTREEADRLNYAFFAAAQRAR